MDLIPLQKTDSLHGLLARSVRTAIVTHMHSDGDALGSSSGLYHFLREAMGKEDVKVVIPNTIADTLAFIPEGVEVIAHEEEPEKACAALAGADLIIGLDFNTPDRLAGLKDAFCASAAEKVLIDHHIGPDRSSFGLCFSETEVSSASELLYHILLQMPEIGSDASALPPKTADALLAGMTTDTNNFANSVFPSTLRMASELLAAGVDRDAIVAKIYNNYRENRVRAIAYILSEVMETHKETGYSVIILTKEVAGRFDIREGELEGMVNIPLSIKAVKLSVYLREDDGHFRVSIRSKRGVSANALARESFNGGGHEQAAGGRLYFPGDIASAPEAGEYVRSKVEAFLAERHD